MFLATLLLVIWGDCDDCADNGWIVKQNEKIRFATFFIGINRFQVKGKHKNNGERDDPKTAEIVGARTGKSIPLKKESK